MGSLGVGHDWVTSLSLSLSAQWQRRQQPTQNLSGCCFWSKLSLSTCPRLTLPCMSCSCWSCSDSDSVCSRLHASLSRVWSQLLVLIQIQSVHASTPHSPMHESLPGHLSPWHPRPNPLGTVTRQLPLPGSSVSSRSPASTFWQTPPVAKGPSPRVSVVRPSAGVFCFWSRLWIQAPELLVRWVQDGGCVNVCGSAMLTLHGGPSWEREQVCGSWKPRTKCRGMDRAHTSAGPCDPASAPRSVPQRPPLCSAPRPRLSLTRRPLSPFRACAIGSLRGPWPVSPPGNVRAHLQWEEASLSRSASSVSNGSVTSPFYPRYGHF